MCLLRQFTSRELLQGAPAGHRPQLDSTVEINDLEPNPILGTGYHSAGTCNSHMVTVHIQDTNIATNAGVGTLPGETIGWEGTGWEGLSWEGLGWEGPWS